MFLIYLSRCWQTGIGIILSVYLCCMSQVLYFSTRTFSSLSWHEQRWNILKVYVMTVDCRCCLTFIFKYSMPILPAESPSWKYRLATRLQVNSTQVAMKMSKLTAHLPTLNISTFTMWPKGMMLCFILHPFLIGLLDIADTVGETTHHRYLIHHTTF